MTALLQLCMISSVLFPALVIAHGRLTTPSPRECDDSCFIDDPDSPINFNGDEQSESDRWPVNDPEGHPEGQSFVCRISNAVDSVTPMIEVTAGSSMNLRWDFTADHPGDGGLFVSYDYGTETQDMKFFKIANFPQQRRNNGEVLSVALPEWLPAGNAVLRWDWYATHNAPWCEFYTNCIDVNIISSSSVDASSIPSFKIEVGTGSDFAYPAYDCEDCWCWDCDAEDWAAMGMNGPPCVEGVEGNCCDLSLYSAVDYWADSGGGFNTCKDLGTSGEATWITGGASDTADTDSEDTSGAMDSEDSGNDDEAMSPARRSNLGQSVGLLLAVTIATML